MLKLSNIRIPVRIAVACLLPLLAFTALRGKELLDRRTLAADMDAIARGRRGGADDCRSRTRVAEGAGRFGRVYRLKRKVVGRPRCAVSGRRPTRRSRPGISASPNIRKSYAGTKFANNLDIAKKRLAELPKMRSEIDASTTDSQKVMETMVSAVAGLLNVVDAIDEMTENGRIIHQANAMVALMRRKEYAAQGRGWGMIGFGVRSIRPADVSGVHAQPRISPTPTPRSSTRSATQAQIDFVNSTINAQTRDSLTQDAAGRGALAVQRQRRQRARRRLAGGHRQIYRRSQARRRSPPERFRGDGARRRCGSAVGILESAGACARAPGRHRRRGLVCRALDHAAGRATGRHDGDAGQGPERHRGARHRARRRARAHGAGRAGVPRRGGREEPSGSRIRRRSRRRRRWSASATRRPGPPRRRRSSTSSTRSAKGSSSSPRARSPTGSPRSSPTNTRRCRATSTRPSPSCRRPSARS